MKSNYALLFITLFVNSFFSQVVELDTSYVSLGINKLNIYNNTDNQCLLSTIQTDNKVVLCGSIRTANYTEYPYLTRVLEDGSLDPTFNGTGTLIDSNFIDFTPYSIVLQDDGKIVVGGQLYEAGQVSGLIVRYNSNGTLDSTFNGVGSLEVKPTSKNYFGRSITLLNNDIYLAGYLYVNSTNKDFFCAKLNSSGVLDNSFGLNGVAELDFGGKDVCRGVSVQTDGEIILSGYNESLFKPVLCRLNTNGTIDTDFETAYQSSNPQIYGAIYQTIIDDNLITGVGFSYDTITGLINAFVTKVNSDGSLATSFSNTGELNFNITGEDTYGIYGAYYSGQKLVVVGNSGVASTFKMKLFALGIYENGNIDNDFVQGGVYVDADSLGYNLLNAVNVTTNKKIIATGYTEVSSNKHNPVLVQFNIIGGITSIVSQEINVDVVVYPNPVSNDLITIENNQEQNMLFNISNISGQVVTEIKTVLASQKIKQPINLKNGIYILNFYNQEGSFLKSKKIIVN